MKIKLFSGDWINVRGYHHSPVFFVNRRDGETIGPWVVTHVTSGRSVGRYDFPTRSKALAFADFLLTLRTERWWMPRTQSTLLPRTKREMRIKMDRYCKIDTEKPKA